MTADETAYLLWTGGWDSTFRLLDLLLVKGKAVQPYYILESARASTAIEMRIMEEITARLLVKHPRIRGLLQPTRYTAEQDIPPDQEVTKSYERIREKNYIGDQYDWLARFAQGAGVEGLEMSIHREDKAHKAIEGLVIQSGPQDDRFYVIDPKLRGSDEYTLFGRFRFPVFFMSKVEMEVISRDKGFHDLMELTWFCHNPRPDGTPCGVCNPCMYTIEEGLGRRLPFASRVRSFLNIRYKVRRTVRNYPKLYALARKMKRRMRRVYKTDTLSDYAN
jgi:hypothetical protein